MNLEQKVNYLLNKTPGLKKIIKSIYQHIMYILSPKVKKIGDIVRLSPDDNNEYFFGYYDKTPWDKTDRFVLCLRANDTWTDTNPKEKADILLIDTSLPENDVNRTKKIAETYTWNVQQGCMLQWLGPDFSSKIIYNDFREDKYVSIILNVHTGEEKVLSHPVYTVSSDGGIALTLDFSRLYNLRPGYGYYNKSEETKGICLPESTAIWKLDLNSDKVTSLLSYCDFANFCPRQEMQKEGVVHKVNHLMISPNGTRFMVLYRWFVNARKYTRLITCNIDGSDMYLLSDDDMVSHCFWKDDDYILAFGNKKEDGIGYYLIRDKSNEYRHLWPGVTFDGHPSYSPNKKYVITDSYPNRARLQQLILFREQIDIGRTVAKVFSPFKYDNETRCDLHPRWNHSGSKVCFDGVFEGHRGLYEVDLDSLVQNEDDDELNMGEIRFIMPLHGFYNQLIQKSGYDIRDPYKGNKLFFRVFREIDFRLKNSNKSKWYNEENITNKKYIIVFDPLITPDYINWLSKKNPESKIILFYINKVTEKNNPNMYDRRIVTIWTGDEADSKNYKINYFDGIAYFKVCKVKKIAPVYDVFFVGKDKGRLERLLEMKKAFEDLGLKVLFHIVAARRYTLKWNPNYKKFMPYEDVLNNLGRTKAILYLVEGAQDGITIRVIESLMYKIKLITDNEKLKDYDFFNPNNIFILQDRNLKELPEFLNGPYTDVQSKFFENPYFEDMISCVIKREGKQ